MPIKEIKNATFYISGSDGEYHKICSNVDVLDNDVIDESENLINVDSSKECNFTVNDFKNKDGLTIADLYLLFTGICTYKQLTSNNWRRLHGMPMKRRRK